MTDTRIYGPRFPLVEAGARKALYKSFQIPVVDLNLVTFEERALRLVSRELCLKYQLIPVCIGRGSLLVVMLDPTDAIARDDVTHLADRHMEAVVGSEAQIMAAIDYFYPKG